MSLANSYRPKKFSEVLGQRETIGILSNILLTKTYPPAILFMGGWGSGKTTLARIFGNAVLCSEREEHEPCGTCTLCTQFQQNPDKVFNFREIDAASEGSVKNVRDIIEESHFRAVGGVEKKVLLVDECHMLSNAAQNAFLKLLEDGSKNMLFLFCTTDPDKMLRTVFSRTLPFKISEIPKDEIVERLKHVCDTEEIPYEDEALSLIVSVRKGHVRDCFMLLDQLRYGAGVTVSSVRKFLNLDLESEYYRLLHLLTSDMSKLLSGLESLIQRVPVQEIYEGICRASLTCFKLRKGVTVGLPDSDLEWCSNLSEKLGDRALRVARFLTSRPPSRTQIALECDLLSLKHFLEKGFPDEPKESLVKEGPIFSSKIEELEYLGAKRGSDPDPSQDELSVYEAVDILNAFSVEE